MIENQELPLKFSLVVGLLAGLASLMLLKDSGLTFSLSWHWPVSVATTTAVITSFHLLFGKTLYSPMWIVPAVSYMGSLLWLVGAEAYALHQVASLPFLSVYHPTSFSDEFFAPDWWASDAFLRYPAYGLIAVTIGYFVALIYSARVCSLPPMSGSERSS